MNAEKNTKMDALWDEALVRLELMGVPLRDRDDIRHNRKVSFKVVVNDDEKTIRKLPITEDEYDMIKKLEEEYGIICYYLSKDQGLLSEGLGYSSYTMFYVSDHLGEYKMIKETIKNHEIVPVFVVNVEIPEYSELTECEYKNIKGLIINVS